MFRWFNLFQSNFYNIKFVENSLLYLELEYNDLIISNAIANINYFVKNIYALDNILDNSNYIIESKFNTLIYHFRIINHLQNQLKGSCINIQK
ncbi:hypothetical protein [Spiroplasma turonicum]|uniref:Uncharacterized protein n=1 Tax=Spiroplasma turonicum TaxID=216946 RepID=A0A0K1P5Q6_9MOLU|nr:hypothetical protein [Spiroplasma turonicum]AKU79499.1 hypothetical protein STURON_00253 [Spiroplasma turonicum]ALX70521.1 hypothetical protein STURO_v1c02530 [Spiroplasma turonicum]